MLWDSSKRNGIYTVKDRYENIQRILENCGKAGCLFLCLMSIIEEVTGEPIDLIYALKLCLKNGWVRDDFWVEKPLVILEYFTGKEWSRTTVSSLPQIRDNDYTVAIYFNPKTNVTHFRRRYFDVYAGSKTVAEGYLKGYYVFTWR